MIFQQFLLGAFVLALCYCALLWTDWDDNNGVEHEERAIRFRHLCSAERAEIYDRTTRLI